MTNSTRTITALTGLALMLGCDTLVETTTQLTQAVTAEDSALTDDVAAVDDAEAGDPMGDRGAGGDCDHAPGERGRAGEPPEGFGALNVAACAPPVADGVDLGRPPHGRPHLAPLYDTDESHSLDEAELGRMQADLETGCAVRNAELVADFDSDFDGVLSQTEWTTAMTARQAAHEEQRATVDTDGDGEISSAEHDVARTALVSTWDLDDSGDLDADERAAMRADLQALVRDGEPLPPLPFFGARHGGPGDGRRPPPPPLADDTAG